jgi:hypothetical protein
MGDLASEFLRQMNLGVVVGESLTFSTVEIYIAEEATVSLLVVEF